MLDGFAVLGEICGGLSGVRLRWLRDQHRWPGELLRLAWLDYLEGP